MSSNVETPPVAITGLKAGAEHYFRLVQADSASEPSTRHLSVRALGGFHVVRDDGRPVLTQEWQSRKARDLFKVLLARRGRPASRDMLMQTLWPDEDPVRCTNRLSVALSTIRTVLDPERRYPQDHFVVTDRRNVSIANLVSDVDVFLRAAQDAQLRRETGEPDALFALTAAESLYRGDFLEDDAYADWADGFRDEVKAVHLELLRTLATASAEAGRYDRAVRCGLRLLEHDPYDEGAHLDLVRVLITAGRHGEARHRHGRYVAQMAEIGVRPSPFPAPHSS